MRYLLLVFLLLMSCDVKEDNPAAAENTPIKKDVSQNWTQKGVCESANQVKMHGVMNCVVVKWQCPRCEKHVEDLKWKLCENCCTQLNICMVCNKKIK